MTETTDVLSSEMWWLIGLMEGEGTFLHGLQDDRWLHLIVRVGMTDEDVVRRCQAVTGTGTVRFVPINNPRHKDQWVWTVSRREHVVPLMRLVRPHMGARRQEQIDRCLAALDAYNIVPLAARTHCKHGHEFTAENTIWRSEVGRRDQRRACRPCANRRKRVWNAKRRLELVTCGEVSH